jgi:AcrR family transcriptional regulator
MAGTSRAAGARSPRTRNPQGQGSRRRDERVAAADRLIAATGDVEGLSLRAVAREVGAATPSIYLHFPDKAALVRAVLRVRFAQLADAVQAAVDATPEPGLKLRAGCLAYCRFALEHPNAYRVLFGRSPASFEGPPPGAHLAPDRDAASNPAVRAALTSHPGAAAFGFLVECIGTYMQADFVPAGDPFRVATNVWTALHGIVTLRSATPGFPWSPLAQQVDDVLAGLVGVPAAGSDPS